MKTSIYFCFIRFILDNNVHLGNYCANRELIYYIREFDILNGKYVFNSDLQIDFIFKVCSLLKILKKKENTILFFGLNPDRLDILSKSEVLSFNLYIFNLCFSITSKERKKINNSINNFYLCFHDEHNKKYGFQDYDSCPNIFSKENMAYRQGFFFGGWKEGSFSNYPCLKTFLDLCIKNNTQNKKGSGNNENILNNNKVVRTPNSSNLPKISIEVFDSLKSVLSLSRFFDSLEIKKPGAVVFFSKEGYDSFFKEFYRLGIPVICIVNSNESLDYIDYPLLGDNSSLSVISFYLKIIYRVLYSKNSGKVLLRKEKILLIIKKKVLRILRSRKKIPSKEVQIWLIKYIIQLIKKN
jgi:ribosomal protein S2